MELIAYLNQLAQLIPHEKPVSELVWMESVFSSQLQIQQHQILELVHNSLIAQLPIQIKSYVILDQMPVILIQQLLMEQQ